MIDKNQECQIEKIKFTTQMKMNAHNPYEKLSSPAFSNLNETNTNGQTMCLAESELEFYKGVVGEIAIGA